MNPYQPDQVLVSTLTKLLGDTCSHEANQQAEVSGWATEAWGALADMGAPWVGVDEAVGGSGGTLADAAAVLRLCGRFAAPVPVAETGLLGGWALGQAGIALPDGAVTVVPGRPEDALSFSGDRLSGVAHAVPWAARSQRIVVLIDSKVIAVDPAGAEVSCDGRRNVAGEPRETVRFDNVSPAEVADAPPGVDLAALRRRGAFARAALMTGALERAAEMTVDYANERHQFGKPVATFQAVAQHMVRLMSETQLAVMAFHVAVAAGSRHGLDAAPWEVAAFKAVAGESADEVTARAHQVHAAIGMTQEYSLHQITRRLWSWRQEFGSTTASRRQVGAMLGAGGAAKAWPTIVAGTAAG